MTHFSEHIPVVKRHMSVLSSGMWWEVIQQVYWGVREICCCFHQWTFTKPDDRSSSKLFWIGILHYTVSHPRTQ